MKDASASGILFAIGALIAVLLWYFGWWLPDRVLIFGFGVSLLALVASVIQGMFDRWACKREASSSSQQPER